MPMPDFSLPTTIQLKAGINISACVKLAGIQHSGFVALRTPSGGNENEPGMTPMQTLVASTGNAAKVMKIDSQVGSLQPGKRADFMVLTADPLVDIKNTRTIDSVWIDGRRFE